MKCMPWWMKKKLHASVFIICGCLGIIIGVATAFWLGITFATSIAWLILVLAIMIFCLVVPKAMFVPLALIAGLLAGWWRTGISLADLHQVQQFNGQVVTITGKVFEDPDIKADGSLAIKLHDLTINSRRLSGDVYIQIGRKTDIKRSDIVTVNGKLSDSFGSFAGSIFRAQVNSVTRPKPGDIARQFRDWFGGLVRKVVPEPAGSLGLGYLVGQRRSLSTSLIELLKITGLTHIVVASGYNLTIVVRFARRLFMKVSKFAATFAAFALILGFIAIAGVSPSMLRAGLVAGLSLLAWYYGRKFHPVNLILLVAATTLLLSPSYIVDLGWLLSFGSFVGVLVLAPFITAYFFGKQKVNAAVQVLIETFSAQICVLPILIYFFGEMSVVSLLTNMLILPTIPIAMLLVFASGVTYLIWPVLANLVGWVTTKLINYHLAVMNYFGNLGWAMLEIHLSIIGVAACYGVLAGVIWYMKRATGYELLQANVVE